MTRLLLIVLTSLIYYGCQAESENGASVTDFEYDRSTKVSYTHISKFTQVDSAKAFVLLVEMIHWSPLSYYDKLLTKLEQETIQAQKSIELEETMSCRHQGHENDEILAINRPEEFDYRSLEQLFLDEHVDISLTPDDEQFAILSYISEEKILSLAGVNKCSCRDRFGVEKPFVKKRPNEISAPDGKKLVYQGTVDFMPDGTSQIHADVSFSKLSPLFQIIVDMFQQCQISPDFCSFVSIKDFMEKAQPLFTYLVTINREKNLTNVIVDYLNQENTALIVPWGSNHADRLAAILTDKVLLKEEYKYSIKHLDCSDAEIQLFSEDENLQELCRFFSTTLLQ